MFAGRCVCGRNRPQPSATVRNRSRENRIAVPMVSSAKGATFWKFIALCSFISRGRRGTS